MSRDLVPSDLEIRSVHLNNVCIRSSLVQAPCRDRGLTGFPRVQDDHCSDDAVIRRGRHVEGAEGTQMWSRRGQARSGDEDTSLFLCGGGRLRPVEPRITERGRCARI